MDWKKPMKYSTRVKPISYLKSHAAEIAAEINQIREPMMITQNGEAKMVLMDVKSYEEQEATFALLKLLAMGNAEIEQGKFRDAEEVFAELEQDDLFSASEMLEKLKNLGISDKNNEESNEKTINI